MFPAQNYVLCLVAPALIMPTLEASGAFCRILRWRRRSCTKVHFATCRLVYNKNHLLHYRLKQNPISRIMKLDFFA